MGSDQDPGTSQQSATSHQATKSPKPCTASQQQPLQSKQVSTSQNPPPPPQHVPTSRQLPLPTQHVPASQRVLAPKYGPAFQQASFTQQQGTNYQQKPPAPRQAPPALPPAPQSRPSTPLSLNTTIEQRVFDLFSPYRDDWSYRNEWKDAFLTALEERKVLMLCENVAFLVRQNQLKFNIRIDPSDIFIATRNWHGMLGRKGCANMSISAIGTNFSLTIVGANIRRGDTAVDKLLENLDDALLPYFPRA